MIDRTYRSTVVYPERRDESPAPVRRPFGLCHSQSSLKDFDRILQLEDEPPELVYSDDDMLEPELEDISQLSTSGNCGAPTFADIENISLLENHLL
jgi:hypothetical protein